MKVTTPWRDVALDIISSIVTVYFAWAAMRVLPTANLLGLTLVVTSRALYTHSRANLLKSLAEYYTFREERKGDL